MGETYEGAGVSIAAGDEAVARIKERVRSTFRPEVLTDIGAFGGLFRFDSARYREPVLVSGTDGVGTKLKIAALMGRHLADADSKVGLQSFHRFPARASPIEKPVSF